MKAFSFSHLLTLLLTMLVCLSALHSGKALGQEPQTETQRIVVADRQLESQAATAWGIPGTLFVRSLRWSDNSISRIPVMWISQVIRLEISFFQDFNGNQSHTGAPLGPQILELRLVEDDKVFYGNQPESREEFVAHAQSSCKPDELAGRLQLGEWAESWGWGRQQNAMGTLFNLGISPTTSASNAINAVIAARPLSVAALVVCTKFDGLEVARSAQTEPVAPVLKAAATNEPGCSLGHLGSKLH